MLKESDVEIKIRFLDEFKVQLSNYINLLSEYSDFEEYKKNLEWFLNLWDISRIDVKNQGNESNSLRIFENVIRYEPNLNIDFPNWFSDETGQGIQIEHTNRKLNISFQCINKGDLRVILRGSDYRNKLGERIPISVIFSKVIINHAVYLDKSELICHDEPYYIKRQSNNLERINLEVESETIYDIFPRLKSFFKNIENKDDLKREYDNFINYVENEKNILQQTLNQTSQNEKELQQEDITIKKPVMGMFGSCVSIDPFRSCYNNYKKDFEKRYEHQRCTIISLMNSTPEYNEDELVYLPNTPDKHIVTNDIKKDFNKDLFYHLDGLEYLIINLVHDVRWGVLEYENTYITNSEYIPFTNFYKNNESRLRPINMTDTPEEYFDLWTKCWDKFFEYISTNYPNIKIILQKIELVDKYLSFDGTYKLREDFREQAVTLNPFFKKLESYIEDNFDVEVIPFPPDICGDEGNIWGVFSTHYIKTYYQYVYDKIRIITLEDMIKDLISNKS